jgi:Retron-type reverse transcriptase
MTHPAKANSAGLCSESHSMPTLEHIASEEALYQAFLDARKGKRNRGPVERYERNLGANLIATRQALLDGSYRPRPTRQFMVQHPKPRVIDAPAFYDSVVQHSIYRAVYPAFDRGFIHDNYGCRIGKGTHRAADQLQRFMRQCEGEEYYLQLDIRKFYYSINHDLLRERVARKVSDPRVVGLMMQLVGGGSTGLFIGNLLSQLFGLIYLDRMDHHIKRHLRIKRYLRYVDDFVLVGLTLAEAQELKAHLEQWLADNLQLELSKWRIAKVKQGINFVGFRTWRSTRFVRRRSMSNFSKALRAEKIDSVRSILANAKHTASHRYFIERIQRESVNDDLLSITC